MTTPTYTDKTLTGGSKEFEKQILAYHGVCACEHCSIRQYCGLYLGHCLVNFMQQIEHATAGSPVGKECKFTNLW